MSETSESGGATAQSAEDLGLGNASRNANLEGVPQTSGDLEGGSAQSGGTDDDRPPLGGAGSGRDSWASYAEGKGVEVTDDMSREDIIAALDE